MAYLNNDGSRASILLLFSESQEHILLTQPAWERGITYIGTDNAAANTIQPLTQHIDLFLPSADDHAPNSDRGA